MSFSLDPIALVPNITQAILLGPNADLLQAAVLTNESPYSVRMYGLAGNNDKWLAAWAEDIVWCDGSSSVLNITPTSVLNTGATPSASLLISVYEKGDTPPRGNWPASLVRQTTPGQVKVLDQYGEATAGAQNQIKLLRQPGTLQNYITGFLVTTQAPATQIQSEVDVTQLAATAGNSHKHYFIQSPTQGGYLQVVYANPQPGKPGSDINITLPAIAGGGASSLYAWGFAQ